MRARLAVMLLLLPTAVAGRGEGRDGAGGGGAPLPAPIVHVATLDGAITPAASDYVAELIEDAARAHAACLVMRLNTPGGLLSATRDIVGSFLAAPLPVVVYVAPAGAQAASAGVFVTLAAHVAAMAPGTNIGAAHPVTVGEQPDSVMMGKITNDAAAFIRTISAQRHRNVRWAEDAVRRSLSITEAEALRDSVIDIVAPDVPALLSALDGRRVRLPGGDTLLRTSGAVVVTLEKSTARKVLDILGDPNIAYLFMMLGFYGLLFELYNPGAVLPGIAGVIALILGLTSLHTLPINYAGLALIVFAVILFVVDLKVTSHGFLTAGGIASLLAGSTMLIRRGSPLDAVGISWSVIITVVLLTAAFFIFALGAGVRAQRRKPATGIEGMIGETGEALTPLAPGGQVRIHGEIWNARSEGGEIPAGARVRAVAVDRFTLTVRKEP